MPYMFENIYLPTLGGSSQWEHTILMEYYCLSTSGGGVVHLIYILTSFLLYYFGFVSRYREEVSAQRPNHLARPELSKLKFPSSSL